MNRHERKENIEMTNFVIYDAVGKNYAVLSPIFVVNQIRTR